MMEYFNKEIKPEVEKLEKILTDVETASYCCDMPITESGFCTACWEHA